MEETWISGRRMIQLPGLTIDRHISAPNELDFPGCNHHLFQAELDTAGLCGNLYTESLMQLLFIHLLRQYCVFPPKMPPDVGGMPHNRLQPVLDYIHSYLERSMHLAELAEIVRVSEYYFCRLFKQFSNYLPSPMAQAFFMGSTIAAVYANS